MSMVDDNASLVRERSRVQFSAAAPLKPLIYMAHDGSPVIEECAEPCVNTQGGVAENCQVAYDQLSPLVRWLHCDQEYYDPASVYRYYDDEGRLLYIGLSGCFEDRDRAHLKSSYWRPNAVMARLEIFPWSRMAEAVETSAIRFEEPTFNVKSPHPDGANWPKFSEYLAARDGQLTGLSINWVSLCDWGDQGIWYPPKPIPSPKLRHLPYAG